MNIPSIHQVYTDVKSGTPLASAIPKGADLAYWRIIIANYVPGRKVKPKRRRTRSNGRKRTNYAQQVVAIHSGMLETVKRTNEPMSEAETMRHQAEWEAARPADDYGLAVGVDY